MANYASFQKKINARYLVHLSNFSAVYQRDLCEISINIYVFSTFSGLQRVDSSLKKIKCQYYK